jgi:hypothetical protein
VNAVVFPKGALGPAVAGLGAQLANDRTLCGLLSIWRKDLSRGSDSRRCTDRARPRTRCLRNRLCRAGRNALDSCLSHLMGVNTILRLVRYVVGSKPLPSAHLVYQHVYGGPLPSEVLHVNGKIADDRPENLRRINRYPG